jgi:hypothetical protein
MGRGGTAGRVPVSAELAAALARSILQFLRRPRNPSLFQEPKFFINSYPHWQFIRSVGGSPVEAVFQRFGGFHPRPVISAQAWPASRFRCLKLFHRRLCFDGLKRPCPEFF